jgi:hypothetical protein
MTKTLAFVLAVTSSGCASMITLRGSSSDFLQPKATSLPLSAPMQAVQPVIDQLFVERGFVQSGVQPGQNASQVYFYKGARAVPPEAAAYGIQLGSWFAVRIAPNGPQTVITVIGKPMIGQLELCSDADSQLSDVQYACSDTKVPTNWAGQNLVTGRDETEVVTWVLTGIYERLKN